MKILFGFLLFLTTIPALAKGPTLNEAGICLKDFAKSDVRMFSVYRDSFHVMAPKPQQPNRFDIYKCEMPPKNYTEYEIRKFQILGQGGKEFCVRSGPEDSLYDEFGDHHAMVDCRGNEAAPLVCTNALEPNKVQHAIQSIRNTIGIKVKTNQQHAEGLSGAARPPGAVPTAGEGIPESCYAFSPLLPHKIAAGRNRESGLIKVWRAIRGQDN